MLRPLLAVAVGGVTGATARWVIGALLDHDTATLLLANTAGTLLLGFVVASYRRHTLGRTALGTGVCGGLTTFSGLTVALAQHLESGALVSAAGLLITAFALGVGAFGLGMRAAK